jgi:hypothetical protein
MTPGCTIAATGTIYSLTDPRTGEVRYIGQTVKPLRERLGGHMLSPVMRVRLWVNELQRAGLAPVIAPVIEDVPLADLNAAERGEITRLLIAGADLLNESATADGRRFLGQVRDAERKAAEHAAWAELAEVALSVLGGPLPPGTPLTVPSIPDTAWEFMSRERPAPPECENPAFLRPGEVGRTDEEWRAWQDWRHARDQAERELRWCAERSWGYAGGLAPGIFSHILRGHVEAISGEYFADRTEASRLLTLAVWYMTAVTPWRELGELAGLPMDDASFIAWAGRNDKSVREALVILATSKDGRLKALCSHWDEMRFARPGVVLAAITAAYAKVPVPGCIQVRLSPVLKEFAKDHEITQPMADLLHILDPDAVESVFGPDYAVQIDGELDLPPGTSGRVIRAVAARLGSSAGGLKRVADRSVQELPVKALPDFRTAWGHGVITARVISGSLVAAGLAEVPDTTADEYLAMTREIWTPRERS